MNELMMDNIDKFTSYIEKQQIETRPFIDGNFCDPVENKFIEKYSSYSGLPLPKISACGENEINKSVSVAKKVFEQGTWKDLDPEKRKKTLYNLVDLMEKNREELAILDTIETSRAYHNYYYDSIPKAIDALKYFAESIDKYYDKAIPPRKNDFAIISREPLGVVGIITPWNDPLVVATWKYAPALLMGNSVIIKPAEQSSYSILKIAELTKKAGIPNGVFNVVPGFGEEAGKLLALHKDVDGIFFTGSSDVGKLILQYSGQSNMKKIGLECGGKSPFVVSSKCNNIAKAAKILAANIFYNQGQICSAPSRAIILNDVMDEFLETLKKECEEYVPNSPYNLNSKVGCVVSVEQYNKIQNYISLAKQDGTVYQAKTKNEMPKNACCIQPTIITDIPNNHRVAQEEIFGPVVVILRAKDLKDAISIANDTKYGLAAAIWTDDINEAYYASKALNAGIVHINSYGDDDNSVPFGGVKNSGLGKDKSMYAFDEYSNLKTVWMKTS